jgi:hypothetical protein
MAARWETLTGRPTSSAECPTHFSGLIVPFADTELIQRTPGRCGTCGLTGPATGEKTFAVLAGIAARWETLAGRFTTSAECPTRFNGISVPDADTEWIRRSPWPVWDLRPDQPHNWEDLRCAGEDGGAVGGVDGATHEQRRMDLSAIQNGVRLLIPGIDQTISGIESACGRFPESAAPNLNYTELMRRTPRPVWEAPQPGRGPSLCWRGWQCCGMYWRGDARAAPVETDACYGKCVETH